jgi:hypothetical protein
VAKASDLRAGSKDADKAGLLSGLLAEENEFDRRSLFRIGSWGFAAVGAVVLAVAANQFSMGWRRDQLAAADLARQAQQIQSLARESQNETRRLASAIDTLNSDRDRLFARVTVVEQGLDSVTGAISKQAKRGGKFRCDRLGAAKADAARLRDAVDDLIAARRCGRQCGVERAASSEPGGARGECWSDPAGKAQGRQDRTGQG